VVAGASANRRRPLDVDELSQAFGNVPAAMAAMPGGLNRLGAMDQQFVDQARSRAVGFAGFDMQLADLAMRRSASMACRSSPWPAQARDLDMHSHKRRRATRRLAV
jgi:hypothetical protein